MIRVSSNWRDPLRKMTETIRKFPSQAGAASAVGQYAAAQEIMKLAVEYAPLGPSPDPKGRPGHPGALKAGAFVRLPQVRWGAGRSSSVEMGFEGLPYQYMVYQHEDASLNHPQGGRAFFLSSAVDERRSESARIIARYVNDFIRSGVMPALPTATIPQRGQ